MAEYRLQTGKLIQLGPVLGIGGEGTVYEIVGHETTAAKICRPSDSMAIEGCGALQ